jgi:hypothetical protein
MINFNNDVIRHDPKEQTNNRTYVNIAWIFHMGDYDN